MVLLPDNSNSTGYKVDAPAVTHGCRPYLGMSQLGHSCERFLWYYFRWCFDEEIIARKQRIFDTGNLREERIIDDLKGVGIQVFGDQLEVVGAHGHAKGHIDGMAYTIPEAPKTIHLLEFKTHNDKSFKELCKLGVEKAKPTHYAQMQRYMKALHLTRAMYIALNKNDETYYFERVNFDNEYAKKLVDREVCVIEADSPDDFRKIGGPAWFECKWCPAQDVCHYNEKPLQNCRTCTQGTVCDEGVWQCGLDNSELSIEKQRVGCDKYKSLIIIEEDVDGNKI